MSSSPRSTEHNMVNDYVKTQFYSLLFRLPSIFKDKCFLYLFLVKYFLYIVPNTLCSGMLSLILQYGIFLPHPHNSFIMPPKQLWLLSASQTFPSLLISERKCPPLYMVPYIRSETMACQALLMGPIAAAKKPTRRTSSFLDELWLPCPIWLKRTAVLLCHMSSMVGNEWISLLVVEMSSELGGQPTALIHNKDILQVCVMFGNFQDTTILAAGQNDTVTLSSSFVLKDAD